MRKYASVNKSVSHFFSQPASKPLICVHDQFIIRGGGERLILELARALQADLMAGTVSSDSFPLETLAGSVFNLNAPGRWPGLKTWQLVRAFQHHAHALRPYHTALYSGVAAPLAVHGHDTGRNVFYCHTPPRFLYDKKDHYLDALNPLASMGLKALNRWFRPRYEHAVSLMDVVVANSRHIQKRIKYYLGRDSVVVYPPCDTNRFSQAAKQAMPGHFYLSTARLDPLKRVDTVIRAFRRLPDKQLVVASGGSETQKLRALAGDASNIHFTGWLDDRQYEQLLAQCLATIYIPKDEDFGMSPVESMAAGKPVFCSDHGGLQETVINQETGFFIDETRLEDALVETISRVTPGQLANMQSACQHRAEDFDSSCFIKKMAALLE